MALWNLSLFLCAVALGALVLILLARVLDERQEARRQGERRRLSPLLLGGVTDISVPPQGKVEQDAAAHVTLEMAELVRGPERQAVLANAERIGIPDILHQRSRSRNVQQRLLAAEALAMFPDHAPRVHELLRDPNPSVRLGAALALAQNQAAPPAAELVHGLGLGTRERSLLVASLMSDLVDVDPAAVIALLKDPGVSDAAKLAAMDALASSGLLEHAPLMAEMAQSAAGDLELLPRLYHALGRIGHPSGHSAILRGLADPAWQVRAAAAQAAGLNGLLEAAGRLGELLGDERWWVRFRAGEALWRLGPRGRDTLERVALAGPALARDAAKRTLEERTDA